MERQCKKCAHSKRHWMFGWQFATCEAPQNKTADLVMGGAKYKFAKFCDIQRVGDVGDCSEIGRWFEPKPRSIWLRLFTKE